MKFLTSSMTIFLMAGFCITSAAEQTVFPPFASGRATDEDVLFLSQVKPPDVGISVTHAGGAFVFDQAVTFVSAMGSGADAIVEGAPYSADAVTETVQMLADGNRIVKKVSSHIARDSEGRTRRDQSFASIGPWVSANNTAMVSFISDPVAKKHWVLEHESRTAREMPLGTPGAAVIASKVVGPKAGTIEIPAPTSVAPHLEESVATKMAMIENGKANNYESRSESLGKRSIEGVEAEGTRVVTTIPAGAIGNERPIEMISESWYAASLQTVVLTRNSDPRFGETTYRLENLSLIDPLPSLFQVPRDFTIASGPEVPAVKEFRRVIIPPNR